MRLSFRKKKRGHYKIKSPEQKAREEAAKTDAFLAKIWRDYLRENPTFARQIAQEKFGLPEVSYGEDTSSSTAFIRQAREVKEVMSMARKEFGGGVAEGEGVWSLLKGLLSPESLKAIPGVIQALRRGEQPQLTAGEQPQLTGDQQVTPQQKLAREIERLGRQIGVNK